MKGIQIRNEEVKLLLFAEDVVLYIENLKDSTKKLLELTDSLNLQTAQSMYKISVFVYTNSKLSEREIKKTIPFTIASEKIKYLEINLIKEVKDLYTENCKTLLKEIKEDTNKWKDITCS